MGIAIVAYKTHVDLVKLVNQDISYKLQGIKSIKPIKGITNLTHKLRINLVDLVPQDISHRFQRLKFVKPIKGIYKI